MTPPFRGLLSMSYFLLLATASLLTARAAPAQTRGNVPGSLPVTPPETSSAGSPRAHRRTEKVPGLTRRDKKRLRKLAKVPANPEGTQKTR